MLVWATRYAAVCAERDALRGEVDRLTALVAQVTASRQAVAAPSAPVGSATPVTDAAIADITSQAPWLSKRLSRYAMLEFAKRGTSAAVDSAVAMVIRRGVASADEEE